MLAFESGSFRPESFWPIWHAIFTQACGIHVSLFFRLHNRPVPQTQHATILSSRQYATEPLPEPHVEGKEKNYPPKIQNIVEEISKLTLLEVADLNELLKVKEA